MQERNRVEQEDRIIHLMRIAGAAGAAGGLVLGEVIQHVADNGIVNRLLIDGGLATAVATISSVLTGLLTTENQSQI